VDLIVKEFPHTEYEEGEIKKNRKTAGAAGLPLFLLKRIFLKSLASARENSGVPEPVMPQCRAPITERRYTLQGPGHPFSVFLYSGEAAATEKRPLFYFIHGGGFVGGSAKINVNFMHYLVDRTGGVAASVDYTLAPEGKYPESLEECRRGLEFLLNEEELGIDQSRITLSGDSAGGNLAAALALKLNDENPGMVQKQVLFYPVTDLAFLDGESYRQRGPAYQMMRKLILVTRDLYLRSPADRTDPYASPLCAKPQRVPPEALILLAEIDGLRSDGENYGKLLSAAGAKVRCVVYKEAYHAFINNLGRSSTADDAAEETVSFITH
jgi:acetyl esterase